MKKICTKCGIEKSLEEFYKNARSKDGRCCHCKMCMSEYKRTHLIANRNKIAKYGRAYNSAHKNRIAKQAKEYKIVNKVKLAEQRREYRQGTALYNTFFSQLNFAENVQRGSNGEILIPCTYCGKFYAPTVMAIQDRIASLVGRSAGEGRFYCSEACKQACPSYNQRDYWKDSKPATSREVSAQFRQLVLKRDNWTCQRCGAEIEAELHVHHIEGATQQPGMSNDLENGITLCKACHKHMHSQNGCRYHELRCPSKDVFSVMPYMSSELRNNTERCPQFSTLG